MHAIHVEVLRRIPPERLERVPPASWERFSRGLAPLSLEVASAPGRIDLLAVTLRDGRCEVIDPLSVIVDEHGYLFRPDLRLRPLPHARQLFDARGIFLSRYLMHAHRWQPSMAIIEEALHLVHRIASVTSD
jgi:hypothetical protein